MIKELNNEIILTFVKEGCDVEIVLGREPRLIERTLYIEFDYYFEMKSFKIDGEDMSGMGGRYFEYNFREKTYKGDDVFCLSLSYDLAEKVTEKLGVKVTDRISLILDEDIADFFNNVLIPYTKLLIEKEKSRRIEEIKKADDSIKDDAKVVIDRDYNRFYIHIEGAKDKSFLKEEITYRLSVLEDMNIFEGFKCEIGVNYSKHYHLTFKELKEVMASIEDIVNEKIAKIKAEHEREEKRYKAEKEEELRYKNEYEVVKKIKLVYPKGGEDGVDGYYRAVIREKATGEEFDIVLRNVFDFGCWTCIYSKEYDEELTDSEKRACKWVKTHAPFTTSIRM